MSPRRPTTGADIAVVGAGPAGAAAAIVAARSGHRVVLIDKARFPRDKCCGDGLTAGALRRLETLGVDPAAVPSWRGVHQATVRTPSGRLMVFPLPASGGIYAATARRLDLDAAMVAAARRAGAEVLEGTRVVGVEASLEDGVTLEIDGGERLRAWYAVAADGMWSTLAKVLRPRPAGAYLGEWHAVRRYLRDARPDAADLWIWFEADLLPGYAWSFPLPDGSVNVGYGVLRGRGPEGSASEQMERLLRRPHIAEVLGCHASADGPLKAWPIPTGVRGDLLSAGDGRVLFAGDAAHAADSMTGEGIGQALETGELAARAIAEAGPARPSRAGVRYRQAVVAGLGVDDRLSRLFSKVLGHRRGADGWTEFLDAVPALKDQFARWMFEDYPRAALLTPHRWQRRLFHRPGAFSSLR